MKDRTVHGSHEEKVLMVSRTVRLEHPDRDAKKIRNRPRQPQRARKPNDSAMLSPLAEESSTLRSLIGPPDDQAGFIHHPGRMNRLATPHGSDHDQYPADQHTGDLIQNRTLGPSTGHRSFRGRSPSSSQHHDRWLPRMSVYYA